MKKYNIYRYATTFILVLLMCSIAGCGKKVTSSSKQDTQTRETTAKETTKTERSTKESTSILTMNENDTSTDTTAETEAFTEPAADSGIAINPSDVSVLVEDNRSDSEEIKVEKDVPNEDADLDSADMTSDNKESPVEDETHVEESKETVSSGNDDDYQIVIGNGVENLNKDSSDGGPCPYTFFEITTRSYTNGRGTYIELAGFYCTYDQFLGSPECDKVEDVLLARYGLTTLDNDKYLCWNAYVGTYEGVGEVDFIFYKID